MSPKIAQKPIKSPTRRKVKSVKKASKKRVRLAPKVDLEQVTTTHRGTFHRTLKKRDWRQEMTYYALGTFSLIVGFVIVVYQDRGLDPSVDTRDSFLLNIATQAAAHPSGHLDSQVASQAASRSTSQVDSQAKPSKIEPISVSSGLNVATVSNDDLINQNDLMDGDNLVSPDETDAQKDPGALFDEFKSLQLNALDEKIKYWSNYLRKGPEQRRKLASLAKDHSISDSAPVFPKLYDCTTFVETVAALARSKKTSHVVPNLIAIRYKDSIPNFENRNHFPEADWIPNNLTANLLVDITKHVANKAGIQTKYEQKKIHKGKWLAQQLQNKKVNRQLASALHEGWSSPIDVGVHYIPIEHVEKTISHIPSGTIVNIVRNNSEHHAVLITHQAFIIREGNEVLLRHASGDGKIRDNKFKDYFKRLARNQSTGGRPVIGISLVQVKDSDSPMSFLRQSK